MSEELYTPTHDAFVKVVAAKVKAVCDDCRWQWKSPKGEESHVADARAAAIQHCRSRGHHTTLSLDTTTEYRPEPIPPEQLAQHREGRMQKAEEQPRTGKKKIKRQMAECKQCGEIAKQATGIVVHWAAAKHRTKHPDHEVNIIDLPNPITLS